MDLTAISKLVTRIRRNILTSTTAAGSGHVSSSLSAVELAAVLFFKYLRLDSANPKNPDNDRFILSKGHASPLLYALYEAAGIISASDLAGVRKQGSVLEGHPSVRFPYVDAATGSLGQGLSVGAGISLAIRHRYAGTPVGDMPRVFVLVGDGEMAEGQNWEALQLSYHYKLNNLIALVDVNRLGQSQPTMTGDDIQAHARRFAAFGWRTYVLEDGHDVGLVDRAYDMAISQGLSSTAPAVIIARTVKGKGVPEMEDKSGWHGIPLPQKDLESALLALGDTDFQMQGIFSTPVVGGLGERKLSAVSANPVPSGSPDYASGTPVATRKALGDALVFSGSRYPALVVLDGDVRNSVYTDNFAKIFPDRFFQMYIAEQNMVSCALGMTVLGLEPFVVTFGAFLTRAHDQIRMAALSRATIRFSGSHAGVATGADGPSQMALDDLGLFRSIPGSTVFYPADAVSTVRIAELMLSLKGISYLRTTRPVTPVLYPPDTVFTAGGSIVHRSDSASSDDVTIVAAGITVYEALKAQQQLLKQGIRARVIDCYSVKPIDIATIQSSAREARTMVIVEDHYPEGGLGEAVLSALVGLEVRYVHLAVKTPPGSGTTEELLKFSEIDCDSIINTVREICK